MTSEVCSSVAAVSSRIRQHTNWYYGHQAQTVGLKPGINFDLKWSYPYTISVCLHWLYKIDVYIYEFNPRPLRNWQKKQYLWPKLKNYTIWRPSMSVERVKIELCQLNKTIEQKIDWTKVNWTKNYLNKSQLNNSSIEQKTSEQKVIQHWHYWTNFQLNIAQLNSCSIDFCLDVFCSMN